IADWLIRLTTAQRSHAGFRSVWRKCSAACSATINLPGRVDHRVRHSKTENAVSGTCVRKIQHASRAIGDWIRFYNHQRPHQALKMKTPAQAYALAAQYEQE